MLNCATLNGISEFVSEVVDISNVAEGAVLFTFYKYLRVRMLGKGV